MILMGADPTFKRINRIHRDRADALRNDHSVCSLELDDGAALRTTTTSARFTVISAQNQVKRSRLFKDVFTRGPLLRINT